MSKRNYCLVIYSLTPHDDEEEEIEGAIEGIVEPDNMNSMMEPPSQPAQQAQPTQPSQQAQPTQPTQPTQPSQSSIFSSSSYKVPPSQ